MATKHTSELQGVIGILKESLKLLCKNKLLLLSITIFTLLFYSILALGNTYSVRSLLNDFSMKALALFSTDPSSPEYAKLFLQLKEQLLFILVVALFFFLLLAAVSVSSIVATIYVSAISYSGKELNLRDLFSRIKKIWKRPVITWLYLSLLNGGLFLVLLPIAFIPIAFMHDSIPLTIFGSILFLLACLLNVYLAMVWILSLVISVLEDYCGLQALGEAAKLIKGRKVQGFVLTLVFTILGFLLYELNMLSQGVSVQYKVLHIVINLAGLVKIFSMIVYTVFYFECKKNHGEEVQIDEDIGYNKLSEIVFVDAAIP